ncbi:hypothetical protein MRX96_058810 [Rhipicephalus microplus]
MDTAVIKVGLFLKNLSVLENSTRHRGAGPSGRNAPAGVYPDMASKTVSSYDAASMQIVTMDAAHLEDVSPSEDLSYSVV